MDSPVSAFAIYKSNTSSNKAKKTKKKNKSKILKPPSNEVQSLQLNNNEISQKELASKLKKKYKQSKELKNIKKKQHKKKLEVSKKDKKVKREKKSAGQVQNLVSDEDEGDLPILVPAPLTSNLTTRQQIIEDEVCSLSSNSSLEITPVLTDSVKEGEKAFKWMIAPFNVDEFFKCVWEKKPLHIARNKPNYYKELITTAIIDDMLRNENIYYSKNIDITSYVNGVRETHNPEGRAHTHLVWDFYLQGCSIRLLNPQTYIPKLHLLNATMQEFFKSFVGANAYLTPPDSQGFAPHYDDIEAFILQTEGMKLWRIYKPIKEVLPRFPSKNFEQNEIGEPIMEVTLKAGDMLYFPRGYIHQGVTIEGEHSLHVTISMYQRHAWADLMEKLLPSALRMAIDENVEFRRGLPLDIYDNFGLVHSDVETPRRKEILNTILSLIEKIKMCLPLDDIVDQMNKTYQHSALPPVLNDNEKAVTVFGDSDVMINGKVINRVEINPDTKIRLLRKNILRVLAEDTIKVCYYVENSLEYHGCELPYIDIGEEQAAAIQKLIHSYPAYIAVEEFDMSSEQEKLHLADALWSRGLIMTETPMENIDDD